MFLYPDLNIRKNTGTCIGYNNRHRINSRMGLEVTEMETWKQADFYFFRFFNALIFLWINTLRFPSHTLRKLGNPKVKFWYLNIKINYLPLEMEIFDTWWKRICSLSEPLSISNIPPSSSTDKCFWALEIRKYENRKW